MTSLEELFGMNFQHIIFLPLSQYGQEDIPLSLSNTHMLINFPLKPDKLHVLYLQQLDSLGRTKHRNLAHYPSVAVLLSTWRQVDFAWIHFSVFCKICHWCDFSKSNFVLSLLWYFRGWLLLPKLFFCFAFFNFLFFAVLFCVFIFLLRKLHNSVQESYHGSSSCSLPRGKSGFRFVL